VRANMLGKRRVEAARTGLGGVVMERHWNRCSTPRIKQIVLSVEESFASFQRVPKMPTKMSFSKTAAIRTNLGTASTKRAVSDRRCRSAECFFCQSETWPHETVPRGGPKALTEPKKKKTYPSCATKPGHYDAHAFVSVVSPTSISPTRTMAAVVATSRKPAFNPFQFDRVATAPFIL
jgi:hypothetical protein